MRRAVRACLLVVLALGAGCDPVEPPADDDVRGEESGEPAETVSRATFIDVYVELRRARAESDDSAAFAAARRAVLERHDATPEALRAFIRGHGRDVDYLADLWETIRERLEAATAPNGTDGVDGVDDGAGDDPSRDAGSRPDASYRVPPRVPPGPAREPPGE